MAKKKSKTQKLKKNQKAKQKRVQKKILEQTEALKQIKDSGAVTAPATKKAINTSKKKNENGSKKLVEKNDVKYNVAITEKDNKKLNIQKEEPKKIENNKVEIKKENYKKTEEKRKLTDKNKVIYNVPIRKSIKEQKNPKPKVKKKLDLSKIKLVFKKIGLFFVAIFTAIIVLIKRIAVSIKKAIIKYKKNKAQKRAKKELKQILKAKQEETVVMYDYENEISEEPEEIEEDIDPDEIRKQKEKEKKEKIKKKNIFVRLIYDIVSNRHIFFNAVLILFFIVLVIGMTRIEEISRGTIIYVSLISIFLITVAISYNRYLSGKLFTIALCAIMGFAIYRIQYTYDFIRNLNSTVYEYKTYYVVTFNNNQNKSIYNINNKKVGLYKENTINIERKLNTKLDKVNYIEYEDLNKMFDDFYNQNFRAVLVNENQYKYMKNYINDNSRDVKILYEFKANAKK